MSYFLVFYRAFFVATLLMFTSVAVQAGELPDFRSIVKKNSAAVVKISVKKTTFANAIPEQYQEIPEILRHFFDLRQLPQPRIGQGMGSGFLISSDGYILTNHHVVDQSDEVTVRLADRREYKANVVGLDKASDLALLKIDEKKLPYLTLKKEPDVEVGEWVLAIGAPFGLDYSATAGIVSAKGRSLPTDNNQDYVPFIQTDVAINPGNSGGPLFNTKGEVVGINSQILTQSGGSIGLSFAIPSSVALSVIQQLKDHGSVNRGFLGVKIQEVSYELAESFSLKKPKGALVAALIAGGAAEKSGIQVGDIITQFNGVDIQRVTDLPHAVGQTREGQSVLVEVVRQGKIKQLFVEVGSLEKKVSARSTDKKRPKTPTQNTRIGVLVEPVNETLQQRWGVQGGVMVKNIAKDSAAEKAGLRPGDVITMLDGVHIDTRKTFNKVQKALPTNKLVPMRIIRAGKPIFVPLRVQ